MSKRTATDWLAFRVKREYTDSEELREKYHHLFDADVPEAKPLAAGIHNPIGRLIIKNDPLDIEAFRRAEESFSWSYKKAQLAEEAPLDEHYYRMFYTEHPQDFVGKMNIKGLEFMNRVALEKREEILNDVQEPFYRYPTTIAQIVILEKGKDPFQVPLPKRGETLGSVVERTPPLPAYPLFLLRRTVAEAEWLLHFGAWTQPTYGSIADRIKYLKKARYGEDRIRILEDYFFKSKELTGTKWTTGLEDKRKAFWAQVLKDYESMVVQLKDPPSFPRWEKKPPVQMVGHSSSSAAAAAPKPD